jgi:hypothetical protein
VRRLSGGIGYRNNADKSDDTSVGAARTSVAIAFRITIVMKMV